jgi:UDP-N-acetylglucosamine:LPS N-acetylglucosamine transferase
MKEPFESMIKSDRINPIIIRNRDEILPRKAALDKLGIKSGKKVCLFAFNGKAGEFERIKKMYSYLEDVGYRVEYTTNYKGGLFPAVDYFNAFDLVICGAGYNAFWEAVYFKKEAVFVPVPRRFESQEKRINECQGYSFDINGADQLVDIILNL